MIAKSHPHLLLVEGADELRILPHFMEKNSIPWGETNRPEEWPTKILDCGGIDILLSDGFIEGKLKISGLKALGIIADANGDPIGRWKSIRALTIDAFPTVPEALPPDGLAIENEQGLRFGVWLMPDNSSPGMMETFLAQFADIPSSSLWKAVQDHCRDAKANHGAPFKVVHEDKALIHSWLALQDPPGRQLHNAIMENILKPNSPLAESFVTWFRKLYRVDFVPRNVPTPVT